MGNTMMNASYQVGTMAVWLGTFADPEEFYRYVQTCYCTLDEAELDPEYIFSPAEFEERLHKLFRPENGERPEEAILRRAFRTQYNAFEYDFGLLFDEDFAVCDYCMEPTEDLSLLLEEFGSVQNALCAYHAGWGVTQEWLADPEITPDGTTITNIPYGDTRAYVRKVLDTQEIYRELYGIEDENPGLQAN